MSPVKVIIVDDINNPPDIKAGEMAMSRSKWNRLQAKQAARQRTLVIVCQLCWKTEKNKNVAHTGELRATGKDINGDTRYEHFNCPSRAVQIGGK